MSAQREALLNTERAVASDRPRISIVTVCRNALDDLETTVRSVRASKAENCRFIVIDGGSTDGSLEFLQSCVDVVDLLISEPDRGIYDAMNKGVAHCADRSWVIFMNAGDTFRHAGTLREMSVHLGESLDSVMGGVALSMEWGERIVSPQPGIRSKMPACHQSIFTRAQVLKEHPFDITLKVGADFEQYLRISRAIGSQRMSLVAVVISTISPEGFSARNEHVLQRDYFCAIARHRGRVSAWRWLLERKVRRAAGALLGRLLR